MLILKRYIGQRIFLQLPNGQEVTVVVTEIDRRSNSVKVGIEAPRSISIVRAEIAVRVEPAAKVEWDDPVSN
ncbi:carbon storage regulator [Tuwongella immobilis]|uniref:Translational regulator CsrA n=1 Tax=Tuwongella immobilis TaxID=692036 RepID=A0A6C2YLA1_9BACT|nr:carbon storage regulator [Tuwongella immobilis]VIP02154.1 carbon storage regulator : : CsrA [Tuwongella immobilis]VTS00549.1 carbon storage regulator : : CsrA [Tuwongella immobilis]